MFRLLAILFALLLLAAPASAQCSCGPNCPCGLYCACDTSLTFTDRSGPQFNSLVFASLVATIDPFASVNKVTNQFNRAIYQQALASNKAVVVGVGRDVPAGNWISAHAGPDSFYKDNTLVVMRPNKTQTALEVVSRLGDIDAAQIDRVLAPPAPPAQASVPVQQQPVAYYYADPGAGGCAGGAAGSFGSPVSTGRVGLFGGLRGGLFGGRLLGGSCGPGGCN